jgi:hypothetical protein
MPLRGDTDEGTDFTTFSDRPDQKYLSLDGIAVEKAEFQATAFQVTLNPCIHPCR